MTRTAKREQIMLRLLPTELAEFENNRPQTEPLAVFVRRMALQGLKQTPQAVDPVKVAAFIIGALSPDIDPDQALALLKDHLAEGKED